MALSTFENLSHGDLAKLCFEHYHGRNDEAQNRKADNVRSKCEIEREKAEITKLNQELEAKKERIAWLEKALFGSSSEKRTVDDVNSLQLWLEGMGIQIPDTKEPKKITVEGFTYEVNKPDFVEPKGPIRFTKDATVIEIEVPNPLVEGIAEEQLELVEILEHQKVAQFESPYIVVKIVQKVFKKKGSLEELRPPALPEVMPGTIFDVSFLAGMAANKYQWHLPIYRQHQAMKNAGIFLDRGHLIRVLHNTGILLEPIYEALKTSVLSSSILAIDETPTRAIQGKKKIESGYFWTYFGELGEIFFEFSPSRGREVLDKTLVGFKGTILSDGYIAYKSYVENLAHVVGCQCWNHARRKFISAEKKYPEPAAWVLGEIQKLYRVEKKARGKPPAKILELRQSEAKPIIEGIYAFLEKAKQEGTFTNSDTFLKAANYVLTRQNELLVYLSNPEVPIDTNHVERELRCHAVGRKNWLFHVTKEGADCAGIFYSLIRSCILADVNPIVYFIDVLQRIDQVSQVELLIPRLWKENFADNPLKSPRLPVLA